jgi:hypothetical protein
MKRLSVIATALLLCVAPSMATTQNQDTTTSSPAKSPVRLLPGYKIQMSAGIDTWGGTIWKDDGLKIEFNSGLHVGVAADLVDRKDVVWREVQDINGQEVICVYTNLNDLIVSFPRLVTNFQGHAQHNQDIAEMLLTVLTFEPTHGYAVDPGAIVPVPQQQK